LDVKLGIDQYGIKYICKYNGVDRSFTGLIAFLRTKNGFYKFATYNGGKIKSIKLGEDALEAKLTNPKHMLESSVRYSKGSVLKAPKNRLMLSESEESITAETTLRLSWSKGNVIFRGSSQQTGMEIAGSLEEIIK